MEREFKWKASAQQFDALCQSLGLHPHPQTILHMDAIYYDDTAHSLRDRKIGLRLRSENGRKVCCMKLRTEAQNGLHVHEEYECAADTLIDGLQKLPAHGASADLCQRLAQSELIPIAHVCFDRQPVMWTQNGFSAELSLDIGTLASGSQSVQFCEIECEYKEGDADAFQTACEAQAARFALTPEPLSKLARALSLSKV